MPKLLAYLLFPLILLAQNPVTAVYPGAVATDSDLLIQKNAPTVAPALGANIDASTLTIPVTTIVPFANVMAIQIDTEIIKICSIGSNVLNACTGGRGFDGTTAVQHSIGVVIRVPVIAYHHNALASEVKAIQTALGTNFASGTLVRTTGSYPDPSWITSLATSKLTGTLADARVAQSNVTQHQASLSIGWNQLTGLGSASLGEKITLNRLVSGNTMDIEAYNSFTSAGVVARLRFDGNNEANNYGAVSIWTKGAGSLTEAFRVTRSQNVLVGTNTDNVGKLQVAGIIETNGTGGGLYFNKRNTGGGFVNYADADILRWNNGTSDLLYLNASGTVTFLNSTSVTGVTRSRFGPGAAQSTIPLIAATAGNALTLGINDTEYARITSSGDLGLGTATVQNYSGYTTLDIDSATNGGLLNIKKAGTTVGYLNGVSGLTLLASGTNALQLTVAGAGNITLNTNGSERGRITSSGNFLYNTNVDRAIRVRIHETAAINYQLMLSNAGTYHAGLLVTSDGTVTDNYGFAIIGGANTYQSGLANSVAVALAAGVPDFRITTLAGDISAGTPTARFVVKNSTGNVLIGTATDLGSKLHVKTATNENFRVRRGTDLGAADGVTLQSSNDVDDTNKSMVLVAKPLVVLGGNTLLNSTSDIGSNGGFRLTVKHDATYNAVEDGAFVLANSTTTTKRLIMGYAGATSAFIQAVNAGTGYTPLLLQASGGNVLIGTTTDGSYKLNVAGNAYANTINLNNGGGLWQASSDTTANGFYVYNASIPNSGYGLIVKNTTGNVLLGTITDAGSSSRLQVSQADDVSILIKSTSTAIKAAYTIYERSTTGAARQYWLGTGINSTADFTLYDATNSKFRWSVTPDGNTLFGGAAEGNYRLDVQSSGSSGTLRVYDQTATTGVTSLVVRAGAGQSTTALQSWKNNSDTTVLSVDGVGQMRFTQANTSIEIVSTAAITSNAYNDGSWKYRASTGATYLGSNSDAWSFLTAPSGTAGNAISWSTMFKINSTGIGFFGVTPVARAAALTAANASALNTGDATSDTVIGNMRTRIAELESKLQAYGLLN